MQIQKKETIMHFYRLVYGCDFNELNKDKIDELDTAVEHWRYFFVSQSCGLLSLMTFAAEKMITSNGRYTAITPAEKMYFYIKMIDPEFLFLEAYEAGNTINQIKELCLLNFRLYDPMLIRFEKSLYPLLYNDYDYLWTQDKIKR